MEVIDLQCCGIRELSGLSYHRTAAAAMKDFCKEIYSYNDEARFIYAIFSQAGTRSAYGDRLEAYVVKNGLGTVIKTSRNVNPNSDNELICYVWTLNHEALKAWAKKRGIEPADDTDYNDDEDYWKW